MRILVTGSSGMVGQNLLEHSDIVKFELLKPASKQLNLLSYIDVNTYLRKNKPDMVIHLAGRVGGIQANIANPIKYMLENMDMGRNIVYASKENGVKKLLNLGSSCIYPKTSKSPLGEHNILEGKLEPTNEGYALAKITTLKLCEYIRREHEEFKYKTIIPCNLYGRYDKFDPAYSHMVPAIIHKLHQAKVHNVKQIAIWGDGSARREFMFAADLADCIIKAIENFETLPDLTNIGVGTDYSVQDYYETIAKIIGYSGQFNYDLSKPVGVKQKLLDITKQTKWGWKSQTSLEEGISKTYEFYLQESVV